MSTPTGRAVGSTGDPYGIAAAQQVLDAALSARNTDIVSMAREGAVHADIAALFHVTRSLVSRLVREHADQVWSVGQGAAPARAETYQDRLERARQEWLGLRHAARLHAEERTNLLATELREYAEGREGTSVDDLPLSVPTWAEYRKTASHTASRS